MKTIAKNFGPGGCIPPIVKPGVPVVKPNLKDQVEFTMKDKDGNGSLTAFEHMAGASRKEVGERYQEFKRYDTNCDGKLTQDEFVRGRQMDRFREAIKRDPKPEFKPFEPKGEGAKESSGFFGKLLKGLAFTNPITMPFMIGNWVREKIAG